MAAYAQDTAFISRRAIVLIASIVLHVLLAYGLATAGHYHPATEDGNPVTTCINFSIKFPLKN